MLCVPVDLGFRTEDIVNKKLRKIKTMQYNELHKKEMNLCHFFIFNRRNKSSSETLKNGDVIKVDRKFYYHYGVYVNKGKGKVIHYTGAEGPNDFKGKVRETSLKEFLNGACKVKVCLFPKELDNVDQLGRLPTTEVPIPCSQSVAPNLDSFERNSLKRLLRSQIGRAHV